MTKPDDFFGTVGDQLHAFICSDNALLDIFHLLLGIKDIEKIIKLVAQSGSLSGSPICNAITITLQIFIMQKMEILSSISSETERNINMFHLSVPWANAIFFPTLERDVITRNRDGILQRL